MLTVFGLLIMLTLTLDSRCKAKSSNLESLCSSDMFKLQCTLVLIQRQSIRTISDLKMKFIAIITHPRTRARTLLLKTKEDWLLTCQPNSRKTITCSLYKLPQMPLTLELLRTSKRCSFKTWWKTWRQRSWTDLHSASEASRESSRLWTLKATLTSMLMTSGGDSWTLVSRWLKKKPLRFLSISILTKMDSWTSANSWELWKVI